MKLLLSLIVPVVALGIVGLLIYGEVAFWHECRASHSWWFCFRLLGGK